MLFCFVKVAVMTMADKRLRLQWILKFKKFPCYSMHTFLFQLKLQHLCVLSWCSLDWVWASPASSRLHRALYRLIINSCICFLYLNYFVNSRPRARAYTSFQSWDARNSVKIHAVNQNKAFGIICVHKPSRVLGIQNHSNQKSWALLYSLGTAVIKELCKTANAM